VVKENIDNPDGRTEPSGSADPEGPALPKLPQALEDPRDRADALRKIYELQAMRSQAEEDVKSISESGEFKKAERVLRDQQQKIGKHLRFSIEDIKLRRDQIRNEQNDIRVTECKLNDDLIKLAGSIAEDFSKAQSILGHSYDKPVDLKFYVDREFERLPIDDKLQRLNFRHTQLLARAKDMWSTVLWKTTGESCAEPWLRTLTPQEIRKSPFRNRQIVDLQALSFRIRGYKQNLLKLSDESEKLNEDKSYLDETTKKQEQDGKEALQLKSIKDDLEKQLYQLQQDRAAKADETKNNLIKCCEYALILTEKCLTTDSAISARTAEFKNDFQRLKQELNNIRDFNTPKEFKLARQVLQSTLKFTTLILQTQGLTDSDLYKAKTYCSSDTYQSNPPANDRGIFTRKMSKEDTEQVLALTRHGGLNHMEPYLLEYFLEHLQCFVFTEQDKPIGLMIYEESSPKIQIMEFYIAPHLRGLGFGRAVLEEFLNSESFQRFTSIEVRVPETNLNGQLFLRNVGFKCWQIFDALQFRLPQTEYLFRHEKNCIASD
jgi:GNAT superfamily N-acetyltransferase